jgi:hypothetical protein
LLLDASIAIGWMVDKPTPGAAVRAIHLLQSGTVGIVPDLWYYEVSNARIMAERRGRASAQIVSSHIGDIECLAAFFGIQPNYPIHIDCRSPPVWADGL